MDNFFREKLLSKIKKCLNVKVKNSKNFIFASDVKFLESGFELKYYLTLRKKI